MAGNKTSCSEKYRKAKKLIAAVLVQHTDNKVTVMSQA